MVQCFICFKCYKIQKKCFEDSYGKWSKHIHLFHCKQHILPCLQCKKMHGLSYQSTLTRYVHKKKVHYMTATCAEAFNIEKHTQYISE